MNNGAKQRRGNNSRQGRPLQDPAKLPQSLDAEKGVLGSILLAPERVIDECIQRQVGEKCFIILRTLRFSWFC